MAQSFVSELFQFLKRMLWHTETLSVVLKVAMAYMP